MANYVKLKKYLKSKTFSHNYQMKLCCALFSFLLETVKMKFLSFWRHNLVSNLIHSKFKYPITYFVSFGTRNCFRTISEENVNYPEVVKSCVQFFSTIVLYLQYESSRKSFFKFISLLRSYLVHYSKAFLYLQYNHNLLQREWKIRFDLILGCKGQCLKSVLQNLCLLFESWTYNFVFRHPVQYTIKLLRE